MRKVAIPKARSIEEFAFKNCHNLRYLTLHPDVEIKHEAFSGCLSLEVLAASANFEIDTGDKAYNGRNDPTRGITRYLKWRNESDATRKECLYTFVTMFKLCETDEEDPLALPARAKPNDQIMEFLVENGDGTGIVRGVLSFLQGETRGKSDLRGATKEELLAVGLELKVLREENNVENQRTWGVNVDDSGEIISLDDKG